MESIIKGCLVIISIYMLGSVSGWLIEVFWRRFFTPNRFTKKWVNPGFLNGPYLPLYGFSLVTIYVLGNTPVLFVKNDCVHILIIFAVMAFAITVLEYVAGLFFVNIMHVRLWDYSKVKGNIKGIICPRYSFYWLFMCAFCYFVVNCNLAAIIIRLSKYVAFAFFIGFLCGLMFVDIMFSFKVLARIRKFAYENQIDVKYEDLKERIIRKNEALKIRASFFFQVKPNLESFNQALIEYLKEKRG